MAVFAAPYPVNQVAAAAFPQAPASPSILTRLRLETRGEHDAVERVLSLMDAALTEAAYRQRLAQFYGFYGPLEAALQARCAPHLATLLPRLNKTALLRQDLQQLGVSSDGLPLCRQLPPIQTQAEVLGCLYVMEGATLGGRLITQHVQAAIGIMPATGGRFFEGYGPDTGRMWQTMRQLLLGCAVDTPTENAIVANAIATFASLRAWCEQTHTHTHAKHCANDDTTTNTEANQRA